MHTADQSSAGLFKKAVGGIFWSACQRFSELSLKFAVGIVLARILLPEDFGLIAITLVIIGIGSSIADAGFGAAIIQRQNLTSRDLSSVFYLNLCLAIMSAVVVWLVSTKVAVFYARPELAPILGVSSFAIILVGLGNIQEKLLCKQFKFDRILRANVPALVLSGSLAIIAAYRGWGVWALVIQLITQRGFYSLFLWFYSSWKPGIVFSLESVKPLFAFGSRLAVSGLLTRISQSVTVLVIGKVYTPTDLGYYDRACEFQRMGAQNISGIVDRVMFPLYATIQDDRERTRRAFLATIFTLAFLCFPLMALLAAVAEPLISVLIGEKWLPAADYLRLLCVTGALLPLHAANLSILKALGRSKLFLRLEIIKKIVSIGFLLITYRHGIIFIIYGQIAASLVALLVNGYFNRSLISVSYLDQAREVAISAVIAVTLLITLDFTRDIFDFGALCDLGVSGGVFLVFVGLGALVLREKLNFFINHVKSQRHRVKARDSGSNER